MKKSKVITDEFICIEAASYDSCSEGCAAFAEDFGEGVIKARNGGYITYNNVDFGTTGVDDFEVEVATPNTVGWIELRLDSNLNAPIGICQVVNTGGWSQWSLAKTGIYGGLGVHTLYLTFKGPDSEEVHIRSFSFGLKNKSNGIKLGNTYLPPLVPYMGPIEKNFIGSDTAGAGGLVNGIWDFLIGPDYTSINYIKSEELRVEIDDTEYSLNLEMHRVKGSGMFCGRQRLGELEITVLDFTNMSQPWVARLVSINNTSSSKTHSVSVKAYIIPAAADAEILCGSAVKIVAEKNILIADTAKNCNWADRCAIISFNNNSTCTDINGCYVLHTDPAIILPGEITDSSLYHYTHYLEEWKNEQAHIDYINVRKPILDYQTCLKEWEEWLGSGTKFDMRDERIKDIVEGTLVLTKMQQNRDGGFMATARVYALSYLRDSHGASRGLLAAGYTEEARKYILCEHHKFKIFGHIPNAVEMGNDAYAHDFGGADNHAAETPAYYVLCARNYYEKTGDIDLLIHIEESMKSCVDIQIEFAEKNGWKLPFNGDETEQFTIKKDGEIWGGFGNIEDWDINNWSMTSLAACAASVDFYIKYLKLKGELIEVDSYIEKLDKIKGSIDLNFWRNDLGIYDWERKKDGSYSDYRVPNFSLLPFWINAPINEPLRGNSNIVFMTQFLKPNGYLPTQPGAIEGICGHNLGYLLYGLTKIDHPKKHEVYNTLVNGGTVSCWGTWSEYYGPHGMGNTRNMRIFESNINMEAILGYWGSVSK
jgi:hypothetical protein